MTTTPHRPVRVAIIIDIYNESPIAALIWARQSAHGLTSQLWDHGVVAHVAGIQLDDQPTVHR